jgi:hypothetical protein
MDLESARRGSERPQEVRTHVGNYDDSVVVTVVDAVAELTGEDPADTSVVLADVIDPDALERLVDSGGMRDGSIRFTFSGCQVVVQSSGAVRVNDSPPGHGR